MTFKITLKSGEFQTSLEKTKIIIPFLTDIEIYLGWSPITRGLLIAYNILVIVLSLFGNVIVLYGSLKHDAIRMDKVSLLLIQNLAVSDIITTLIFYFPTLLTLFANRPFYLHPFH